MKSLVHSVIILVILPLILAQPAIARKNAFIAICAETGKIHTTSNPDLPIPPSSLTKMMTLYLAFHALREGRLTLDQKLPISAHAARQEPCKLWLKKGNTLKVRDAILGMVTKSANDAAVVLAEALGNGSEKAFAERMTKTARKLGMKNTVFKNASGLPNKHQITTARDMAILSRALYREFPEYFKFFQTKEFAYKGTIHRNHNHLLGKVKGLNGIKTGFTCASGFNLAASMVRDNHKIIAVVLGGETRHARDKKMVKLLESTYAKLSGKSEDCSASISGLIHAHAISPKKARKPARLSPKPRKKKITKVRMKRYQTLNQIFQDLEVMAKQ